MSRSVGQAIELTVGQRSLVVLDREPIGVAADLLLETLSDRLVGVFDLEFYKRRERNGTLAGVH